MAHRGLSGDSAQLDLTTDLVVALCPSLTLVDGAGKAGGKVAAQFSSALLVRLGRLFAEADEEFDLGVALFADEVKHRHRSALRELRREGEEWGHQASEFVGRPLVRALEGRVEDVEGGRAERLLEVIF